MMKQIVLGITLVVMVLGCEASDSEDAAAGNGPPCVVQSDCPGTQACVNTLGITYCQIDCSVSADECGVSSSCTGVGAMSISVCQPAKPEVEEEENPTPEAQPTLPCVTDADCTKFQANAICAQFQGVKDCTIPCAVETDCDMPVLAGISIDFMTCINDEGDDSRSACLPDEACCSDPLSCTSFGNMEGLEGLDGLDGLDGFGDMDF